jgi:hypothetical protein
MSLICANTTLTASFATLGTVDMPTQWAEFSKSGNLTIWLKYTKDSDQVGGYPVVRLKWQVYDSTSALVTGMDPLLNSTITVSGGVATVLCDRAEYDLSPVLTDSDGTEQYPLMITAPPYAAKLILQAKQAGDTTAGHFGGLAAELSRMV